MVLVIGIMLLNTAKNKRDVKKYIAFMVIFVVVAAIVVIAVPMLYDILGYRLVEVFTAFSDNSGEYDLHTSTGQRLAVIDAFKKHFWEKPILGHGFYSFMTMPYSKLEEYYVDGAISYEVQRNGMYLTTTSSTNYTDNNPSQGYNSYEVIATDGQSRSQAAYVNIFYDGNSSGGNGGGGSNPGGGNTEQESVVLSTPVISNITSSSATIVFDISYSAANLTAVGIMYARTANYDFLYASLSDANLATLQRTTSGNYSITFNLTSLNPGTQYVVEAFAATSKSAYSSSEKKFTTSSGSSSGGTESGYLTVNKTNLTGTWKSTFNGGDEYYWVLQSSGTAYSIVDESSYWTTGSYHKFSGTWTVGNSSFTFKQTKHYYYEGGTLDYSENDSDTETVNVRSLTSSSFVDGDGNTWTKTSLPSYVKL